MGSADLMPRNLDRRVETLVAVTEPHVANELIESLKMDLAPNVQSWYLAPDGSWRRDTTDGLPDLHGEFEKLAQERRRVARASSGN